MLKIWSTAVTHRAASHRPYWLIWACVCCGGGTSSYIGTSDIDTVNLWLSDLTWHFLFSFLFFPTFLSMSTEYRYIVFSAWEPAVSLSLLLHSLSVLKAALSPPKHPIAPSPPSLLSPHFFRLFLFPLGQPLLLYLLLSPHHVSPHHSLLHINGVSSNYLLMIPSESSRLRLCSLAATWWGFFYATHDQRSHKNVLCVVEKVIRSEVEGGEDE